MAEDFRQRHTRLFVVLSLATLVELAGYAWLGHPHADGGALRVLIFGSAIVTTSMWRIGPILTRHRHHAVFFIVWSASIVAVIMLGTALDGGERSPIAVLLIPPMLFAALAYRPRIVLAMGGAEIVGYVIITFTDRTPNTAYATMMACTLTLTVLMAAKSAREREKQAGELHELAVRFEAQATLDVLTECVNRRGFDVAIDAEVARSIRFGRPMSLLLMDIDNLKTINDTYGHAGGDAAIQQVGRALLQACRPNDVAARFGGDEFALVVPETEMAGALKLAARIHDVLRAATDAIRVTVSIGAATLNNELTTAEELLRGADSALYRTKGTGRGRTTSFDDLPETTAPEYIRLG